MLLKIEPKIVDEETYLQLTKIGGKMLNIPRPFDPYFYNSVRLNEGNAILEKKILLSTLNSKYVWKINFPNTDLMKNCRSWNSMESHFPYEQRVAIDVGLKATSDPPKHDAFDIEMESSRGFFPNAQHDRITALSYFGENYGECKTDDEKEIIYWFIKKVKERNPDVLDTYFGSFADWSWLIQRAAINNIPLTIGRDGSEPWIQIKTFRSGKRIGEDRIVHLGGRVHFDVWKEVDQDQSIFGVKNHQLKTMAEFFGIPVIRVDRANMAKLSDQELHDYCLSDARATWKIAEIYLRNLIPLAERLQIAFNMLVNRSPSHIPNYVIMRRLGKLNIIADKCNVDRYPEFKRGDRASYQGALITLFNGGYFQDINHMDFKGMYPSNMMCFNLSPETLLETRVSDYPVKNWVVFGKNDWIHIYDKKIGTISCKIDLTKEGACPTELRELKSERIQLKSLMNLENADIEGLNSSQWGLKVIMNSISGYNGMSYAAAGSFPIAAQVCGLGRWEITEATNFIKNHDGTPIERDTDGIYYLGKDFHIEASEAIRKQIPEQYDSSILELDIGYYPEGIFYDEKGYVLKKDDGKLIFHGSGLKGKHLPRIVDGALQKVVYGVFEKANMNEVLRKCGHDIKKDTVHEDFLMTIKMSKEPSEYSEKNQYGKLVKKAMKAGMNLRWGDEFQFLKTKRQGYMPFGAVYNKNFDLDFDYYIERVASVLVRILSVTHGYNVKNIKWMLKGGIIF